MYISVEACGTAPGGEDILMYTMENNNGMRVQILNWGGVIHSIQVPDRCGNIADVVLGHEHIADYITNPGYLGAVVGRNCGRIADGRFSLFDQTYSLEKNAGSCNLHSGAGGLSFRLFSSEAHTFNNLPVLHLNYTIQHLDDGFPGNLEVRLIYALTAENALMLDYRAISDKDTVINLTNHSYFNLAGHDSGPIYGHTLELAAPFYTPGFPDGLTTGEVLQVEGTPLDFTSPKEMGKDIGSRYPQLHQFGGYDHNYVLTGNEYRKFATATEPVSGRRMEVFTDLPGVQFFTANHMANRTYKDGASYGNHQGFCLETQIFPNAVNTPWFPSPIYAAGEEYAATTTYQFSVTPE